MYVHRYTRLYIRALRFVLPGLPLTGTLSWGFSERSKSISCGTWALRRLAETRDAGNSASALMTEGTGPTVETKIARHAVLEAAVKKLVEIEREMNENPTVLGMCRGYALRACTIYPKRKSCHLPRSQSATARADLLIPE